MNEEILSDYRKKSAVELFDHLTGELKKDGFGDCELWQAIREKLVLMESSAMDYIHTNKNLPPQMVEHFKNQLLIILVKKLRRALNRKKIYVQISEIDNTGPYLMNAIPDPDNHRFEIVLNKKN